MRFFRMTLPEVVAPRPWAHRPLCVTRRGPLALPAVKNSANSLHRGSAGGYRSRTSWFGTPKEEFREGAYPVPHREHVLGFPGGDLAGDGPWFSPRGRQPGSSPALVEDHRGAGDRRPPHHARRLPEGAHRHRGERVGGSRAAANVRRELIFLAAIALWGCDQGTPVLSNGGKGPPPQAVWTFPKNEATGVALKQSIRVQFDRVLSPASAVRQGVCVQATTVGAGATDECIGGLTPQYDPVDRVAVWVPSVPLMPMTRYNVLLLPP